MTVAPIIHPAPRRENVGWRRQLIGLFGAPTAWAAQVCGSEILSSYACYPHGAPLSMPLWNWLLWALAAISGICLVAAIVCAAIAWISWQRSRREAAGTAQHAMEIGEGRTRFLALTSVYSSSLFVIAIIFTICALFLVSPCKHWL